MSAEVTAVMFIPIPWVNKELSAFVKIWGASWYERDPSQATFAQAEQQVDVYPIYPDEVSDWDDEDSYQAFISKYDAQPKAAISFNYMPESASLDLGVIELFKLQFPNHTLDFDFYPTVPKMEWSISTATTSDSNGAVGHD